MVRPQQQLPCKSALATLQFVFRFRHFHQSEQQMQIRHSNNSTEHPSRPKSKTAGTPYKTSSRLTLPTKGSSLLSLTSMGSAGTDRRRRCCCRCHQSSSPTAADTAINVGACAASLHDSIGATCHETLDFEGAVRHHKAPLDGSGGHPSPLEDPCGGSSSSTPSRFPVDDEQASSQTCACHHGPSHLPSPLHSASTLPEHSQRVCVRASVCASKPVRSKSALLVGHMFYFLSHDGQEMPSACTSVSFIVNDLFLQDVLGQAFDLS